MRTLLCGGRAPGLRPASPGASSWEPVAFPEATLRQATGLDLVSQPLRPFPVSLSLTGALSWATVGQSPRNRAGKGFCGTVAVRSSRPSSATLDSAFLREHQATRHFHHQPPPRGFTPMCRDPRRRPHSCRRPTASPLPGEGSAQSLSATLLPSSGVRFTARAPRPLGSLLEFLAKLFLI